MSTSVFILRNFKLFLLNESTLYYNVDIWHKILKSVLIQVKIPKGNW